MTRSFRFTKSLPFDLAMADEKMCSARVCGSGVYGVTGMHCGNAGFSDTGR